MGLLTANQPEVRTTGGSAAVGLPLPTPDQLATLRSVLGRIGHDLSNLVTPLIAYPPLLRMEMPVGSKSGELVDAMEQTAQDIVGLARQMLDFASSGDFDGHPVDVGDTVRMVAGELGRGAPPGIRVEADVCDERLSVTGSGEKIGRCVQRLWANAVEAMPDGGVLRVSVRRLGVDAPQRTFAGDCLAVGDYAVVEVGDTGKGIDPAVLPSVFMPFFTTRRDRRKRGAGLGLTYVHAITQAHGGQVDVESEPGGGTRVRLFLPLQKPGGESSPPVDREAGIARELNRPGDAGRVLVVDDESSVRESFSMLLKTAMPRVRVDLAANGEEALSMYGEGRHAVVVMDLYMPVKDGYSAFMDLSEMARREGRQMPAVIFCTGYAPPRMIRDVVANDNRHVLLPKPVTARALVDAVRARLSP